MINRGAESVKIKIWEMINPFAFFFAALVICVAAAYFIAVLMITFGSSSAVTLEDAVLDLSIFSYLAFYAAAIFIKGGKKKRAYEAVKYSHASNHWPLWKCVISVVIIFLAASALSSLVAFLSPDETVSAYNTAADVTFGGKSPVLIILTAVVAGPIAEELIFRYMTYGRMRFYIGNKRAIVLSSLLFGLYHANLLQFIYCSLLGVIFAFIYDRSGNLKIPIAAHMAINFAGILIYF